MNVGHAPPLRLLAATPWHATAMARAKSLALLLRRLAERHWLASTPTREEALACQCDAQSSPVGTLRMTSSLAFTSALHCLDPSQARRPLSGVGGESCFANSVAARRAGVQGCRAQRGRGARVGAENSSASQDLLRRRPCDEALGAEHRSAVARRPQAVADRGRVSETGLPTHPATRGFRAPAARQPLRRPRRSAQRRRHRASIRHRFVFPALRR